MAFAANQTFDAASLSIESATPGTYTGLIGIQSFSKKTDFDTKTVVTPNADPAAPGKSEMLITATQPRVITFSGTMDGPTKKLVEAAIADQETDGTKANWKWLEDFTLANGGGDFTGAATLTGYQIDATEFDNFKIQGTITFDSTVAWNPASA